MANFYSIITNRGKELEAEALASGTKITLAKFVVGDGNGQAVAPKPTQTKLINEQYRGDIGELSVSPDQPTQMMAKVVLPTEVGGFTVREIGMLTDAGELYAVANCAAIEKPVGGVSVNMQFRLAVSDTANITLNVATGDGLFLRIDQSLSEIRGRGALAQKAARESLAIVDASTKQKGLVQLNSATNSTSEIQAATPAAVKAANDNAKTANENADKANNNANQRLEKDKNLSDLKDKPQARKNLELGTAATSNVQKSATDGTANALMANGAWGLGGPLASLVANDTVTCFYSGGVGAKTNPINDRGFAFVNLAISGSYRCRLALDYTHAAPRIFYQNILDNTYNPYVEFYTTAKKPTANDVEALPVAGGTMAGAIKVSGTGRGAFSSQNNGEAPLYQYVDTAQTSEYWPIIKQKYKQANSTWSAGMLINANQFVVHYIDSAGKSASFYFRNDGQFIPQSYANFDTRYLQSIRPSGTEEYVDIPYPGQASFPAGAFPTAFVGTTKSTGSGISFHISRVYYRRAQKYIGGAWVNI